MFVGFLVTIGAKPGGEAKSVRDVAFTGCVGFSHVEFTYPQNKMGPPPAVAICGELKLATVLISVDPVQLPA